MRSSIALASFTALAAGTVGVGAIDSVPSMFGSDTLKDLTVAVLNSCGANCKGVSGGAGATYGITYVGTGSGFGQTAMGGATPTQSVAPMSRALTNGICTDANRAGAEGIVVALDGLSVVANTTNAGAEGVDYTGTTAGASGNDWRNVLRQIYAGLPTGNNNIFQRDCNSASRRTIIENWDNVFRGTVSACGDSHPSVAGTAPNRYDQNNAIVEPGVRHAFRRDEESGTTDVFLTLLQLPTVNFSINGPSGSAAITNAVYRALANSPFCNVYRPEDDYQPTGLPANPGLGLNASMLPEMITIALPAGSGAGTGLAPHYAGSSNARNLAPYLPEFMDQDPVRRTCVGSIANQVTANNTNLPFEQVCNADGKLGVVLPINPPPNLAVSAAYPSLACDAGLGFVAGPAVTRPNGQPVRCPNGDVPLDSTCLLPVRNNGAGGVAFDCLNGKNAPPAVTDSDGNGSVFADYPNTDGRPDVDGRVYNLVLRNADGTPVNINRPNPASPVPPPLSTPMAGSFYRIHTTRSLLLPPNATLASSLCTRGNATDQIGCLTASSPCSIGFAGGGASAGSTGVSELLVNGVAPTTTNVQNLITGAGTVYPFARKLYVNSLRGFGAVTTPDIDPTKDAELELIKAYSTLPFNGTINVGDAAYGFIPLPGGAAFCEDFNGQSLCADASNTDACLANPAGIPSSSCSNGVRDGVETGIDVGPGCP